ncbi:uncharacterized protein LOC103159742 [Cricetulus griseus]|uniref:Uncharacterized protein LOC103159742 n=1 Tax=Cricetulus griseus TaxID=10029 RepID=A0A9J7K9Z3_CRIGR|nr:uncharacterized protein LOC103159742 [Cricetulus griseus]XP_035305840.1 uncharacterized protein LOC103159742 [Cricetulus griseus]XP_035305841.1 uncharacterized protein LOC103159742 [Cricetulus griseus]XP_035305842.1 uncharacterized protein LOC103159742 [Cricetulus griseus]
MVSCVAPEGCREFLRACDLRKGLWNPGRCRCLCRCRCSRRPQFCAGRRQGRGQGGMSRRVLLVQDCLRLATSGMKGWTLKDKGKQRSREESVAGPDSQTYVTCFSSPCICLAGLASGGGTSFNSATMNLIDLDSYNM